MKRGKAAKGLLLCAGLFLSVNSAWAEQFSIVVLPDTQFYSQSNPAIFEAQTQWIVANKDVENIIYVAHLGDLKDSADCDNIFLPDGRREWDVVSDSMGVLEGPGIPYSVIPGNHDYDGAGGNPNTGPCATTSPRTLYNGKFGPPHFAGVTYPTGYYGGSCDSGTNDHNYTLFSSPGGIEFIAINLAFSTGSVLNGPDPSCDPVPGCDPVVDCDPVLTWADNLLKTYPTRRAIITSHFILSDDRIGGSDCQLTGDMGTYGQAIWDELKDNPNLFMILSGHCRGEKWLTIESGDAERPCMSDVHLLMSNYQDYDNTGSNNDSGYLRIMRFDTTAGTIAVETYSPWIASNPGSLPVSGTPIASPAPMGTTSVSDFTLDYSEILYPSVVLLPDTSGSMSWDVNGVMGVPVDEQRITFAKEAAKAFLEMMMEAPENAETANFGIATFPNHPSVGSNGEVVTALTRVNNDTKNYAVNTTIPGLVTENATPMLAGVETAADMLVEQLCKSVVLLSDGYHNSPNLVTTGDAEVTTLVSQLNSDPANPTRVFTVSFGKTTEIDYELLQHLADETTPVGFAGSQFFDATTPVFNPETWDASTSLQATYKAILTDVLQLQTAIDPLGIINAGETKFYKVHINEHDTKISFFLSWRTLKKDLLSIDVYDASGRLLSPREPGVKLVSGDTYHILTVDRKALSIKGRIGPSPWRIQIGASNLSPGKTEPFQYSVIMDSGLTLKPGLDRQNYAAGDTITLTAQLKEGRRPITGLSDVVVIISAPGDGRGNWLSIHKVNPEQLSRIPSKKGSEPLAPFLRKGMYLTDIGKIEFPRQKGLQKLQLFDDGSHGDVTAKDGVYTNRFADTGKEGVYSFYFKTEGPTRGGNYFNREQMVQKYLTIQPAAEAIAIIATPLSVGDLKQYNILVTPKDKLGNYLGPGHNGLIQFKAKGVKFIEDLVDNLDGSYTQTIAIPRKVDVKEINITLKIGEVKKMFNLAEILKRESKKPRLPVKRI